jgi:pyrroline-5-carboxylate reductase
MAREIDKVLDGRPLAFLGAGNIAEAMIRGLITNQLLSAEQIIASEPVSARRKYMAQTFGIEVIDNNRTLISRSNTILLGVKPQNTASVLAEIGDHLGPEKLVISVVAGASIATICKKVKANTRVVRIIPNTPVTVMAGAVVIASDSRAEPQDLEAARAIFNSVGITVFLEEKLLDAATGLAGSGPAFVFLMLEALADGGVNVGIPREDALTLAAQTLMGAGKLFLSTRIHPGALKDMVTSPAGTSIAGLRQLENGALRGALINAVRAATERSQALGEMAKSEGR